MRLFTIILILFSITSCQTNKKEEKKELETVVEKEIAINTEDLKKEINTTMDKWHKAAAEADEEVFFGIMDSSCIYLGTDATERWTKQEFYDWGLKHFQGESAWSFTANWRNIYFTDNNNYAWFEESLATWMGECRGSGVLKRINNGWKLVHYNLAVTIDNDKIKGFIELVNQ